MFERMKEDIIEQTLEELKTFTPLEMYHRIYYRMVNGLDSYTKAEKQELLLKYADDPFITRNHEMDVIGDDSFLKDADICISKHCRYMPPKPHMHSFIELFYIFSGSCTHICNHQKYQLQPGDFCFWEFDVPHKIMSYSDDFIALNIIIKRNRFEKLFFPLLKTENILSYYFQNILYGNTSNPMIIFRTGNDLTPAFYISCMYQEQSKKEPYYMEQMVNYLSQTLIYLLRIHIGHVLSETSKNNSIPAILQYIQEHYNMATLSDVCHYFNYSEAYLSRLIKKSFGMTFSEIVKQQRLKRAKWLLESTDMPIPDIALEVGCTDSSHLCRIFKLQYHTSPLKYRQSHRLTFSRFE